MKVTRVAIVALASLAVGAVAVAGCGGDDETSSTTAAISKEDFLTQGNQICAEGNKKFDEGLKQLQGEGGNEPSEADIEQFATDSAVPIIQEQIDQLRALGIPSGDEDQVNAFLDSAQSDNDKLEADPSLLTSNLFADTNKLAHQYGLTECGGS